MNVLHSFGRSRPRLLAGIWFTLAALIIPVTLIFLFGWHTNIFDVQIGPLMFLIIIPAVAGALTGATAGVRIFDPLVTRTPGNAIRQGMGVAFYSSLIFILCFFIAVLLTKGPGGIIGNSLVVMYGIAIASIPITLTGGLAGWLLYRLAVPDMERDNDARSAGLEQW